MVLLGKYSIFAMLSLVASLAFAQVDTKSLQALIAEAEELVLKSKRTDALKLLGAEWQKAKPQTKAALALKMDELARVFMTERGQKAFELGQSMAVDKGNMAEPQYVESLKAEDNNVSVLLALAALKIKEKNWAQALESLTLIETLLPASREVKVLRLKALLAASNLDQAQLALASLQPVPKKYDVEELSAELLLRQEKFVDAKLKIAELVKKQPENPDMHYLKWKLEEQQKRLGRQSGEKYLELCKNLAPTSQKQLSQNPFRCLEQLEVAKILGEFEAQTR